PDPDLFIRRAGAAAFQKVLDEAQSVVGFQVSAMAEATDLNSEVGAMRIARALLATIAHSPDPVQRDRLLNEVVGRLKLSVRLENELRELLRRERGRLRVGDVLPEREPSGRRHSEPAEELALCEHLVHVNECPEIGVLVEKYLPLEMITDANCRKIATLALRASRSGKDVQDLLREAEDPDGELGRLAAQLLMAPSKFPKGEFSRADAVRDIILYKWRRKMEQERAGLGPGEAKRRTQITYDLRALMRWESGAPVIELELSTIRS
ncbi:MAG: hypothetical protein N2255_03375, partial [Kiritimatiellae bacterium]|nr:hypothetical protein [Kiritimatiellia bacterium]